MLIKISLRSERAPLLMRTFKRFALLSIILFLANPASAAETFSFAGNGLGHGVGLSQIGGKVMALEGKSAEEILKYYYTGVTIEPVSDWYDVRVNIGHQLTSATIQLSSNIGQLKINDYLISDKQTVANFKYSNTGIITTIKKSKNILTTLPPAKSISIQWSGTRFLEGDQAVVAFNSGKTQRYQFGQMELKVVGKFFEATNTVRLKDEYLYGISEVSSSWPTEMLRAQVIAARTYAISKAGIYRPSCDCDLYGTTQDQLFVGTGKLSEARYGALWKAAVDSTNVDEEYGLTITYMGNPISAYYSSSSGGMTESALNAFGTDVEYLKPVADPASIDPIRNPNYAFWKRTVSAAVVAKTFGLSDVQKLEILGKRIEATSLNGTKTSLRLETFRSRTGLPSPFFNLV
jgi:stage II sporulation protein D